MNFKQYVFPAALLICNLGAAGMRFREGNWRLGLYWVFSGLCVAMVGFMPASK